MTYHISMRKLSGFQILQLVGIKPTKEMHYLFYKTHNFYVKRFFFQIPQNWKKKLNVYVCLTHTC